MNNESKNLSKEPSAKLADLIRYVGRKIERTEGLIQDSMEDLSANFIMNFEWKSEVIYKANLELNFLRDLHNTLKESDYEYALFILRHAAEHAADDIMYCDPYRNSSNGAANLAHRWSYESNKAKHHIALNLLDRLESDEE